MRMMEPRSSCDAHLFMSPRSVFRGFPRRRHRAEARARGSRSCRIWGLQSNNTALLVAIALVVTPLFCRCGNRAGGGEGGGSHAAPFCVLKRLS